MLVGSVDAAIAASVQIKQPNRAPDVVSRRRPSKTIIGLTINLKLAQAGRDSLWRVPDGAIGSYELGVHIGQMCAWPLKAQEHSGSSGERFVERGGGPTPDDGLKMLQKPPFTASPP